MPSQRLLTHHVIPSSPPRFPPPFLSFFQGLKSHETMCVTPSGSRIAFAGAGGYVHIVCGRLKTWQLDVKVSNESGT